MKELLFQASSSSQINVMNLGNMLKYSNTMINILVSNACMLHQAFAVPQNHPKSKPFVDHVIAFYILDNRIWFRHFQIVWKPKGKLGRGEETKLVEIGPRFVLQPIRVFEGSFGGPTLYKNEEFERPRIALQSRQQSMASTN